MTTTYPAVPMLNYAAPAQAPRRWSAVRLILFVLALPAMVTPFVDFTWGTSPLEVLGPSFGSDWLLNCIAGTFFASFPILLWKARRLALPQPPGRWETRALALVAVIISMPAMLVAGAMVARTPDLMGEGDFRSDDVAMLSLIAVTMFGGLILSAWRCWRRGFLAGVETLLVIGYLTIAAFCLLGFHDDPNIGYWLTVPVAASFATEILLLPRAQHL